MYKPIKKPAKFNEKLVGTGTAEPKNGLGWISSINEKLETTEQKFLGLSSKVESLIRLVNDNKFLCAGAYKRTFTFPPQSESVNYNLLTLLGAPFLDPTPCNVILEQNRNLELNIPIWGNGGEEFHATSIGITIYQKVFIPNKGIFKVKIPLTPPTNSNNIAASQYSSIGLTTMAFDSARNTHFHFLWNARNGYTDQKIADDFMSSDMFMPTGFALINGDTFRFEEPIVFQQDTDFVISLLPTMNIVQLAASSVLTPFGWDDRQGGVRDNSIEIEFVVHGFKVQRIEDYNILKNI